VALEFWAYVGQVQAKGYGASIPDVEVSISGDKVNVGWSCEAAPDLSESAIQTAFPTCYV